MQKVMTFCNGMLCVCVSVCVCVVQFGPCVCVSYVCCVCCGVCCVCVVCAYVCNVDVYVCVVFEGLIIIVCESPQSITSSCAAFWSSGARGASRGRFQQLVRRGQPSPQGQKTIKACLPPRRDWCCAEAARGSFFLVASIILILYTEHHCIY